MEDIHFAKARLADEYDAAQERGEVKKAGNPNSSRTEELPGPADIGLTAKQVHEARQIQDAEGDEPGPPSCDSGTPA